MARPEIAPILAKDFVDLKIDQDRMTGGKEMVAAEMTRAGLDLGDALKGLAHLLGTVAPVFVMADVKDLHAQSMVRSPFTDRPTLYLYDSIPGGVGFARRIWLQFDEIRADALAHARRCPCQHGCPSCVGAVVETGDSARKGAVWLLRRATVAN